MKNVIVSLETIANSVDKELDLSKTQEAIKITRGLIAGAISATADKHDLPLLKELDKELSIWQSKLEVILSETAGRKGMAKHARFWAEKLKMSSR